jgi:transglutaminase-like putative cysteine protease
MQIFTISVFLLAGSALLSINIVFLVYFIALLFTISTGIIFLTFFSQDKNMVLSKGEIFSIFTKTLFIPLLAIPSTAFLFIVLPRTDYPLFNFLNKEKTAVVGFSDNVSLGDVSNIQEDNSIAFRVKMEKLPSKDLYFRGIVLDYFDGNKWTRKNKNLLRQKSNFNKNIVKQTVFLNPYGKNYLFALNYPVKIYGINANIYSDYTLESKNNINKTVKYTVYSLIEDKISQNLVNKDLYLQLPHLSKKFIEFAKSLKKDKSVPEFVNYLVNYFNENYKYSLKNLPQGENPLDDFIFNKKAGNCEFFASATALILRINGIPSRLVAGYKGADYNDIAGYYVVFNKNAHTWVEYYYKGYWHTIDTTPSTMQESLQKREMSLWFKLKIILDTINYYYLNFVVDFNFQKQVSAFKSFYSSLKEAKSIASSFMVKLKENILFIFLSLSVGFFVYKLIVYYSKPYEERLLEKFYKKLRKYGYTKKENEGLIEFTEKINQEHLKEKVKVFVNTFESYYYKDIKIDKKIKKKLEGILKEI